MLGDRYCGGCGQRAPAADDYSIRAQAHDLLDQLASVDGKLPRTLWTLVAKPGMLTTEHLAGRRARYVRPLQLFLLVNVLLFIVAPRVPLFTYSLQRYLTAAPPSPALVSSLVRRSLGDRAASDRSRPGAALRAYATEFDARVETHRKSFILLFVPAVALVLVAIFARRPPRAGVPRRLGEHVVFALHLLAFVWLALACSYGLGSLAGRPAGVAAGIAILAVIVAMLLAVPLYTTIAVRRVYQLTWPRAVTVAALLLAAFVLLIVPYRALMFFTTWATL